MHAVALRETKGFKNDTQPYSCVQEICLAPGQMLLLVLTKYWMKTAEKLHARSYGHAAYWHEERQRWGVTFCAHAGVPTMDRLIEPIQACRKHYRHVEGCSVHTEPERKSSKKPCHRHPSETPKTLP